MKHPGSVSEVDAQPGARGGAGRHNAWMAALAVGWGSCLLFLIQPLLARTLLPVFGGSAMVWSVCLACYQTLLLAGYLYAHGLARWRWLAAAQRFKAHIGVVAAAALWAWIAAFGRERWLTWLGGFESGGVGVVMLGVLLFVLLPYLALAAGTTLTQAWLAGGSGHPQTAKRNVYRLYAVSNFGSLLGLLGYPFGVEILVPVSRQWFGLAGGLSLYALLLAGLARMPGGGFEDPEKAAAASKPFAIRPLWLVLPAATSFLLNAATAHLLVDVTPIPLVWVLPLAAFLGSYMVGFSGAGEGRASFWCVAAGVALTLAALARGWWGTGSFLPNAAAAIAVLFFGGVALHGWLYATRPATAGLTRFYLAVAAGGAAGGLAASLGAPVLFTRITEYPLALMACLLLVARRMPSPSWCPAIRGGRALFMAGCAAGWLLIAQVGARDTMAGALFRGRTFYGCVAVTRTMHFLPDAGLVPVHYLWYGQTTHGLQVRAPGHTRRATTYYGDTGGGIAFHAHPRYQAGLPLKVGIVGLGIGTLATYGRPGDLFRFYEINPQVVRVATDPALFSYLPEAPMPIDLVLGDARRMLERERDAGDPLYDLLVIDAYTGDAVPYHLATREAFELYLSRLEPDGMLAAHISNWHIDLLPLCKAMARELNLYAYGVISSRQDAILSGSVWVFFTRHPLTYRFPAQNRVREVNWEEVRCLRTVITDDHGSLIPLLRF